MSWLATSPTWADDETKSIQFSARYEVEPGTQVGRVMIEFEIPKGCHIYSLQQPTPPGPTKIQVAESEQFALSDRFAADRAPTVIEHDTVFDTRLEQFSERVVFTAPLRFTDGADLEKINLDLRISCQVCSDDGCVMVRNRKVDVRFGGYYDPNAEKQANPPQTPEIQDDKGGQERGNYLSVACPTLFTVDSIR